MTQLRSSELKKWREETLAKQGGRCALCQNPCISPCADHNHRTGLLRGVICRACNSVLGKCENGTRYGKNFDIIAFAAGLHRYLCIQQPYPTHPAHGRVRKRRAPIHRSRTTKQRGRNAT